MKRKKHTLQINKAICFLLFAAFLLMSDYVFSQGAAINTTGVAADPSAILDASSNTQGFLMPRMTLIERNAIVNPAEGLLIFNITYKCFEAYANNTWQAIWCSCSIPAQPFAGTHNSSVDQIVWNWGQVSGATGYKWNSVNDYNTAFDIGLSTTYTQSGLTCNSPYDIYIWAYNLCGSSTVSQFTATTLACPFICGTNVSFAYNGSAVTYGTVNGGFNSGQYCWLDRNLGASQVAISSADALAYGDLFQWGRADDGHQIRTSGVISGPVVNTLPGNSFVSNTTGTQHWYNGTNPSPDSFWQGLSGINNPCPNGFRLPTGQELTNEMASFSTQNAAGAFASPLKLTVAGIRDRDGSAPTDAGSRAYYWSSSVYPSNPWYNQLVFGTAYANMANWNPAAYGSSVRCIKD